jgi:ABC-type nitrate/sulfonate/bicarbonate transport system substrate-binding protein
MVGGLSKQIYLPNMLTQQLGYFKEQNLDVTLVDEQSGVGTETMVLAGAVDAGSGSYNHTLELQAQGKFMETVVQLQVAPGESAVGDEALGQDEHERNVHAGGVENLAEGLRARQILAGVDENEVATRRGDERGGLRRNLPRAVAEQPEGR